MEGLLTLTNSLLLLNLMVHKLLDKKERLRPYAYQEFADAHLAVLQSPWSYLEVAMSSDVQDWQDATEQERAVISGILKGFTIMETHVGCYWRDTVAKQFPVQEIVMMASAFSAQEALHARAYDHLEASLGLDTYDAFIADPVATKKLADIMRLNSPTQFATNLAIFSGAIEGVSLYASFAILLSFLKERKFNGIGQILSWSVLDEQLHSAMGIKLYKLLIEQYPELEPANQIIADAFDCIVNNEFSFIEQAFGTTDKLPCITKQEAKDFVLYRANLKLMELGLHPAYTLNGAYKSVKEFFDTAIEARTHNDFFAVARNGGGYSAMLTQDFANCTYN